MVEVDDQDRILVVDDTEDIRDLLSVILKQHGYNFASAAGGSEMDEILAEKKIDLIILDVMMPGEDGISICQRLKLKASPPIIMLSAKAEDADKIKGLDFGAEDYVSKPFSPDELMARVRAVLRRAKATAAMVASSAQAALKDENVLTPLPQGFKIGAQSASHSVDQSEYVPIAETVDNWSSMVTVQIFHGMSGVAPDAFAQNLAQDVKGACSGTEALKVIDGIENGYAFSIWIVSCPLNPETKKPEGFFMKAIQGNDALYSVQYAFRQKLTKELSVPVMQYLHDVTVCDTRRTDRPCPPGM